MKEGSKKLSRRDFLEWAFYMGLTTVATGVGINIVDSESSKPVHYPLPRWLNSKDAEVPKLINRRDGHESYLRACIQNSPVIQYTLSKVYEERFSASAEEPPKLGNEYQRHLKISRDAFNECGVEPVPGNIIRAANFSLSASAIFFPSDVNNLSELDFTFSTNETEVKQVDMVKKTFPRVFPVAPSKETDDKKMLWSYLGPDRYIHMSQHQLIASEMLHLTNSGVRPDDLMPGELKMLVDTLPVNPALALSTVVSQGWETLESARNPAWSVEFFGTNSGIQTGYYDRFVNLDLAANKLGALAGITSVRACQAPSEVQKIIGVLNHPVVTMPLKDEWHPQVSMDFALPIAV